MTVERSLRLLAGAFVMLSLALGYWVSRYWFLFTAFVGLNLFQSGFTNWCPAMAIFRKMGLPDAGAASKKSAIPLRAVQQNSCCAGASHLEVKR
ncbi:MAG TPA: DUF2892 domain-containing protein [Candidatus Angelobacter sp.]